MKEKIYTAVCTIMIFVPWSILILRLFDWALKSPTAEIMITCYGLFMIFGGIFTAFAYGGKKIQNTLMKICLVINSIYGVAAAAILISIYMM